MRSAFLAIFLLLAPLGCGTVETLPTQSTAPPEPMVSLVSSVVQPHLVRVIWSVRNGEGRQFEIQRRNGAQPWKHYATVLPVDGSITLEDTSVVPGQGYTYRLRFFGTTGDTFLDEIQVAVPSTGPEP